MLDHLQFGSPKDPEIFWTFLESLQGLTDFAKEFEIPCVGGKVSLYNETPDGPIKPSPIIGVLGLIEKKPLVSQKISPGDSLVIVGDTKDEMGGSEYFEYIHKFVGGKCPSVDFAESKNNMNSILKLIDSELLKTAHDCSKGGLAIAISELCMTNNIGCCVSLDKVPAKKIGVDRILFSESHSRYVLVVKNKNLKEIKSILKKQNASFNVIGKFGDDSIKFKNKEEVVVNLNTNKAKKNWMNSLKELVLHS